MVHLKSVSCATFLLFISLGCLSVRESRVKQPSYEHLPPVSTETILPQNTQSDFSNIKKTLLEIPNELLNEAVVTRQHAELRLGPGEQYSLDDTIIGAGTKIVTFERFGAWQKVFIPMLKKEGWLHHKTLKPEKSSKQEVTIASTNLPIISILKNVHQVSSYPDKRKVKFKIPKGAVFLAIKYEKEKVLVWIPETNSVAWLSSQYTR